MDLLLGCTGNTCILIAISFLYQSCFVSSTPGMLQHEMEILGDYSIYYSLTKTKEILMKYYNKNDDIKTLVDEYDFRCSNNKVVFQKRFPFITVEGPYRKTRHTVAQILSRKINGRLVGNPPQFMTMSNYVFNDTTELRRAFYSLGVHGTACKVQEILAKAPVIVAGYWVDQASFGIAKMFRNLPPKSSLLYEWPRELIKPDRVYLINTLSSFSPTPLHPFRSILERFTFRNKLMETMISFRNPSVTVVDTVSDYEIIAASIIQLINKDFNTSFPT